MIGTSGTIHGMLEDATAVFGDRPAMYNDGRQLTYDQFLDASRMAAAQLHKLGIGVGDRVIYWGDSDLEAYVLLFGVAMSGGVFVPANPKFRYRELKHVAHISAGRLLVVHGPVEGRGTYSKRVAEYHQNGTLAGLIRDIDSLDNVVTVGPPLVGLDQLEMFNAVGGHTRPPFNDADAPALVQFTSGTTGQPKGALLAHKPSVRMARSLAENFGLTHTDRYLVCNPICHLGGTTYSVLAAMSVGAMVVTLPTFDATASLHLLRELNCTVVHGIDTHWIRQLAELEDARFDGHLRLCSVGGNRETMYQVAQRFRPEVVVSCYGTTETGGAPVAGHFLDDPHRLVTSAGRTLSGISVDIVDPGTGRNVNSEEPGEIRIGGWSQMIEYIGDPEATAAQLDEAGRTITGDMGYLDADRFLHFLGRIKNIIRVGGENVAAEEVEYVLETHADVQRAVATPVDDPELGEAIFVYLVTVDGSELTHDEVGAWALERMASFKVPRHFRSVAHADLPVTDSGKIDRVAVRRMANEALGKEVADG